MIWSSRTKRFLLALFAGLVLYGYADAATYYIDHTGGNDSNSGTTKASPWATHPYMTGTGVSGYSHAAGDRFIFKGGVTWPRGHFPMTVAAGGSSGSVDYYGVDATWYTGAAWARPIFDFASTTFTGNTGGIDLTGRSYVTIDNLEMKNFYYPGIWYNVTAMVRLYGVNYVTVQNSLFHDWTCADCVPDQAHDNNGCGAVIAWGATYTVVDNCTFYNTLSAYGVSTRNLYEVKNSTFHDVSNAILGVSIAHDNVIYAMTNNLDNAATGLHENAIEIFGGAKIYNNIIYGAYAASFLGGTVWGAYKSPLYLFNNVFYNNSNYPCNIDNDASDGSENPVYIVNNTFHGGATDYALRTSRPGGTFGDFYLVNNHFVGDRADIILHETSYLNYVANNNVYTSMANATAQGYVLANQYAPTASSTYTVNTGMDASAYYAAAGVSALDINGNTRGTGGWDVGAYEYVGGVSSAKGLTIKGGTFR